jgi:extradiol dioxygenase family protein
MSDSASRPPFHLAVPVRDLAEAREFYGAGMGFAEGRSSDHWIDFDMYGHQFVVHLNPALGREGKVAHLVNPVDGHGVPVPHFGVVLEFEQWHALAERARQFIDAFLIEPYIRFAGQPGEQGTMFFLDPSGNALEFKAFRDIDAQLFAT